MTGKLQNFCVRYSYFTGGTNSQYSKFFDLANDGASPKDLANIIFVCSDGSDTVNEITKKLEVEVFNC